MQPSINFRPPLKQNPVFHEGDFESTSYVFPYARKILKFSKLLVIKFFTAFLNCTGICILYTPVCLLYIPVFCIRFSLQAIYDCTIIPHRRKIRRDKSLENFLQKEKSLAGNLSS